MPGYPAPHAVRNDRFGRSFIVKIAGTNDCLTLSGKRAVHPVVMSSDEALGAIAAYHERMNG